jgi:hypothetical protein
LHDEDLLERKISSLGLKIEGSGLERFIDQLHRELDQRGQIFHPPCFLGDEWFCPVGIPAIYIPFYLSHKRLRRLEQKIIMEVEGGTSKWFMQLMRHEAAHAYSFAYRLYKKKKWQEHFGLASTEQTDHYRPRPYSHSYVIHLDGWYAQAHPDEDFAETFAVWLTPGLNWRKKYSGWKALKKLEYVEELMRSIAGKPPVHQPQFNPTEYDCLKLKLKTYYASKRKLYEENYPDFYDKDLRKLFSAAAELEGAEQASRYLRSRRRPIMNAVGQWTNERKYRINQLLEDLISRCDDLDLRLDLNDPSRDLQVASYITTLIVNSFFTGRFKR